MKNKIVFCLFNLSFFLCLAQENVTSDTFLNHLLDLELREDAIIYLETALEEDPTISISNDSIHYFLGILYKPTDYQMSTYHFEFIDWGNYTLSFNKKRHLIIQYLESNQLNRIEELYSHRSRAIWKRPCDSLYLKEAISVLNGNNMNDVYPECSSFDWTGIKTTDSTLKRLRKKSPLMAGALSAVVPGLGKVYAGKKGQGIMAFVTSVVLGWQAVEGYQNGGVNDPRFIIFSSLFGINYVGNIWGSALAVSVNYQNHYNESKNAVLATVRFGFSFK